MNKKKPQEYLDKINQAFTELNENPHEIDVDSLLGYIRIFYSSVKSIPLNSDSEIKISDQKVEMPVQNEEIQVPVEQKEQKVEAEKKEVEIEEIPEEIEEVAVLEEKDVVENIEATSIKEPHIEEEDTISHESEESQIIEEKIPDQEVKIKEDIAEVVTILPTAEKEEIENHSNNIITPEKEPEVNQESPAPEQVKAEIRLDLPDIKESSKYGSKGNILSKIETEQSKPLYTPDNQSLHNPSDAIESLFKEKSPTGLVDFLGLSPLDNISKAWGLNERMLVIKDLFGDNLEVFNETIEMINKFTSFDEVKNYLIANIVHKYSWNDVSRYKKASDFIVQTKRLFVK